MKQKDFVCFLFVTSFVQLIAFAASATDPAVLPIPDFTRLQQGHPPVNLRQHLSASQQAQILSDVQQHQAQFDVPRQETVLQNQQIQAGTFVRPEIIKEKPEETSTPLPSLAKYKVDRTKQQEIQDQLREQHQQINQRIGQNYLQTAHAQYQAQPQAHSYQASLAPPQYASLQTVPNNLQPVQQDLTQPLFSEKQTLQLQNYFEKQRQLELLQRQRDQLIREQQELRRQQELLRLEQLQQLTTTTALPIFNSSPSSSLLLSSPTSRRITPAESELFLKAIANHQKKFSSTTRSTTAKPTTTTTTTSATTIAAPRFEVQAQPNHEVNISKDILSFIQAQESQVSRQGTPKPQIQLVYQTEKPPSARPRFSVKNKSGQSTSSSPLSSERDLLLKQLKHALIQSPIDDVDRNVTTRDLILPNGKKLQVIHAPNSPSSVVPSSTTSSITTTTTTIRPPKAILEELTKGVLPPGADFEVIRHKDDGRLEDVGQLPIQNLPAKKVTFVVLEEQHDGSYKVQGVKGNAEKDSEGALASIVEKIKNGELKLPPSSLNPTAPSFASSSLPTTVPTTLRHLAPTAQSSLVSSVTVNALPSIARPSIRPAISETSDSQHTNDFSSFVTLPSNVDSPTEGHVSAASTTSSHILNSLQTSRTSPGPSKHRGQEFYGLTTTKYPGSTRSPFFSTITPTRDTITSTPSVPDRTSTFANPNSYLHYTSPTPRSISTTLKSISNAPVRNVIYEEKFEKKAPLTTVTTIAESRDNLSQVLKKEGLFAMAKFLRQSGLDSVLNETGPYTIFVPTDKAFRTLLVQLGGPEKAEQKFQDNPRLLSGLLLHHVIPGAFKIDSLQDEMTGVSLAGTQLRVNVYSMQDHEWNDVKVTTVNGARIAPDKKDFKIPQGIAHAIDRVMFPLPVGDLVQTLQADRERRFTTFLRILHLSGLEEILSGPKTFTLFAPTDAAFATSSAQNGSTAWSDADGPEAAKNFITRHVILGTLYTAGIRYYQQKDTLRPESPLHIHKNSGRIRINDAKVVTYNVPATNGVIHAIDSIL